MDPVGSTDYIPRLEYGDAAAIRRIEVFSDNAASIAVVARSRHISGAIHQDVTDTGRTLFRQNTATGQTDDRPARCDQNVAVSILNSIDSSGRPRDRAA